MAAISMSELLSRYNLSEEILRKECSDDDIIKVAPFVEEWEMIAPPLGVNADDVKARVGKPDPALCRRSCLQLWKEQSAFKATYYSLLEVLLESKLANTACKVCAFIAQAQGM